MLIDRQGVFPAVVLIEVIAEPVLEISSADVETTKIQLEKLIKANKLEKVKKENNEFYVVPINLMTPIEKLFKKIGVVP